MLELTTVAFRTTKILSTVKVDISVDRSVQIHQNLVNVKSWHFCSFQNYLTPGRPMLPVNCRKWQPQLSELPKKRRRYASWWLFELTAVAFRALLKKKHIINLLFCSKFLLLLFLPWVIEKMLKPFRILIVKPWNFKYVYVRSLKLPNYTIMLLSSLPW